MGTAFVHTVIDDHCRVAYAEIHDDETAATAIGVLRRAVAWFAARGVTVERVLSDNGSAYRSHAWRDTCAELGITPKRTRPYRPQTNGKIERFHRTLADGWAFRRLYLSESARRKALPAGCTSTTITGPTPPAGTPPHHPLDQPVRSVHLQGRRNPPAIAATATTSSPAGRARPRRCSTGLCRPAPAGCRGRRPATP